MRAIAIRALTFILAAAAALAPSRAHAWGDEGHQIVALIAYHHLAPAIRAKVDRLLDEDTDTLTSRDIAGRATWADRYRDSDRHTTKQRYELTREWHFVDIELDHPDLAAACFGHPPAMTPASAGPEKSCVVDRINAFAAELRQSPAGGAERAIAFKFLLHLVGDIHQPLHASDHQDRGGNDVHVLFGRHKTGQSLHGFWDTAVVESLGDDPLTVAKALNRRFGSRCGAWMNGTPADWAWESFGVAKTVVYQFDGETSDRNGKPAHVLAGPYLARASAAAGEQLEKAGCRLAMVLTRSLQ